MYHLRSPRFRRWPYQANVMNKFEITSRQAVWRVIGNERSLDLSAVPLAGEILVEQADHPALVVGRQGGIELRMGDVGLGPKLLWFARRVVEPLPGLLGDDGVFAPQHEEPGARADLTDPLLRVDIRDVDAGFPLGPE